MKIGVVHARDHMPNEYRDYLDGQRAIRIMDENGEIRGELVWRLASRWRCTFEIKEFGIFQDSDRRKGWGTTLLQEAIGDMEQYIKCVDKRYRAWRIYLFCEEKNAIARSFYEARGFQMDATLKEFYGPDDDAMLYSLCLADRS